MKLRFRSLEKSGLSSWHYKMRNSKDIAELGRGPLSGCFAIISIISEEKQWVGEDPKKRWNWNQLPLPWQRAIVKETHAGTANITEEASPLFFH